MKNELKLAKPEHEVLYQEICALVDKHAHDIPAHEVLAVAANLVGKLIAMQDSRTISPAFAMEIVVANITHGNKSLVDGLLKSKGSC